MDRFTRILTKKCFEFSAFILFLFGITAALPPAAAGQRQVKSYDLVQVVSLALEHNRSLEAVRHGVEASNWNVKRAYSEFLPRFSLSQRLTRVDNVSVRNANFAIEGLKSLPGFEDVNIPPLLFKDTYQTGLTVTVPVYNGGRLTANLESAKTLRDTEELTLKDAEAELSLQVVRTFVVYVKNREFVQVRRKSLELAESNLKNIKAKNKLGLRPKSDILRWEAQVATDESSLIETENTAAISKISLANIMGIELEDDFEVVGISEPDMLETIRKYIVMVNGNLDKQVDRYYREAVNNNAGRTISILQTELSRTSEKLAKSAFLPRINFAYNYGWQGNDTPALDGFRSWDASIQFSYSIFNGFADYSDLQKARAETHRFEKMQQDFDRNLFVSIYSSLNTIKSTLARITLFEKNLVQALDNLKLIQNRYNLGLASNIDLIDAQALETSAQVNLINTRYDLYIDGAELERTVGKKIALY